MIQSDRIAIIDCQLAGVSGDMFLGAFLDLGANINKIITGIKSIEKHVKGCKDIQVDIRQVTRRSFKAKKIDVTVKKPSRLKAIDILNGVDKSITDLKLPSKANQFAMNTVNTLLNAEARCHGKKIEDVNLHETGEIDTLAEIVGLTIALEDLKIFNSTVYSTPVAVGGGLFKFSHAKVASPAPATLEILKSRNFPILGGPVAHELVTPTGASILVNLAENICRFYPLIKPFNVGYGAGINDFKEIPNVLRIILGVPIQYNMPREEIIVLETNLDDVTGELVGHTMDKLFQEGAKDVSIIPIFTKKNRPGQILRVITDREKAEHLSHLLIKETGTLGTRMYHCERQILLRDVTPLEVIIEGKKEMAHIKISKDVEGRVIQLKPEYDSVKKIADKTGKPLREIIDLVLSEAYRKEAVKKLGTAKNKKRIQKIN